MSNPWEEAKLTEVLKNIGYSLTKTSTDVLPNGKSLVRLDYELVL